MHEGTFHSLSTKALPTKAKNPAARPGVRAHRNPGALGGHGCVLPINSDCRGDEKRIEHLGGGADFGAVEAHSSSSDPSTSLRSA